MPGIPGTFEASHFHVRTSSEHTIDGQHSGAELHVVHNQVNGGDRQAVFAFMIQPGAQYDNPYFNYLLDGWTEALLDNRSKCGYIDFDRKRNLHEEQREDRRKLQAFNVYDFVPSSAGFYQYDGGLTEPPCSEVVWWNLADAPLYISIKQFNELINLTLGYVDLNTCLNGSIASPSGSTSRPVQPLNGRRVTRICPAERRPGGAATTARQVGKQKVRQVC